MDTLSVEIEHINFSGRGVARDARGNTYFVAGAIPGDRVEIRPIPSMKRYQDAELVRVLKPSKERVEPPCPYFGDCGGCDYLNWDYGHQLAAKEKMVLHALQRHEFVAKQILPAAGASRLSHYRNRIQVRWEGENLGFYRKKSHSIVDIEKCYVAANEINEALTGIRQEMHAGEISTHRNKIELYRTPSGEVVQTLNQAHSAGGFEQIHYEQNEVLKSKVVDRIKEAKSASVLELYSGSGNLSFAYLGQVAQVAAVDLSAKSIVEGKKKAAEDPNGHRIQFIQSEIPGVGLTRTIKNSLAEANPYDTLLMDPPRSGVGARTLKSCIHPKLNAVISVSCSTQTFIQDAQALKNEFDFHSLQLVDMFPHTRHIELVALFLRR